MQEYGEKVLSAPPSTGFNSIAWYIPGVAFALGLGIVVVLIRLWRQRDIARLAAASGGAAERGNSRLPNFGTCNWSAPASKRTGRLRTENR